MRGRYVSIRAQIEFTATITVTEEQMRALDALVGYGDDDFIVAFEEKLGKAYMRDHHAGLKSFFRSVREQVLPSLSDVDTARRDMAEAIRKRQKEADRRLEEASAT